MSDSWKRRLYSLNLQNSKQWQIQACICVNNIKKYFKHNVEFPLLSHFSPFRFRAARLWVCYARLYLHDKSEHGINTKLLF
jgi:hypothetical protein